jgi:hypothetical protein
MKLPEQMQFRGSAESKGFRPVEQASSTAAMERETDRHLQQQQLNLSRIHENKTAVERSKLTNIDGALKTLSSFSATLTDHLEKEQKKRNEAEEEEGQMLYWTKGVSQEQLDDFDRKEQQIMNADAATRIVAGEIDQQGGDPFVAEQFRGLSGYRALGYAKAMAMKGGSNYPAFYAEAAANTSVLINGQEVTLSTAKNPAERAAVESEIRRQYLRKYAGINPALLNKYLFPQMQEYEARQAVEWGEQRNNLMKSERLAESQDSLFTAINAGQGGQAVVDFVNQRAGDFGGVTKAREAAAQMLREGVRNRQFNQSEIDAILNHEFVARDGSKVRLGDYWGRDFGDLGDLLYDANRVELTRELQQQDDAKKEFQLLFEQQTAQRGGKPWTEAELKEMGANWESQGLGPAPEFLKDYMSKEDRDNDDDKNRLRQQRQARGYLTEEDLRGVSPEVYAEFIGQVKADEDLAKPDEQVAKNASTMIGALVSESLQETDGQTEKTTKWHRTRNNAVAAYATYYREYIRQGKSEEEANNLAMLRVEKNIKAGSYSIPPSSSTDQKTRETFEIAMSAVGKNPNLIVSGVIPGTESALAQARNFADTGKGDLPLIYKQLAQRTRGLTAWDIADAQLKASGHPGMVKPRVEQAVDKMDPTLRPLLTWRPTASRANRVAIQTGWKPMLDLIASKESTSYGGYDAMNSGGAAGGTIAYGSANSVNVFGRGLQTMTIGEVRRLQAEGKIHAAGRYQIIQSTLNDLMTRHKGRHGFDDNTPYNAATQDALAIILAQNRLKEGNKLSGLRNEWIGLRHVSDGVLQNAINNITVQSPFNQPDNLHPRLVYRIGSRGYGSTGPHLDLKPVVRGGTQTDRNLPAITKTELDQYVLVGDKQRPLSQGTVTTDDDKRHRARGSYGHDFAAPDGTPLYLKNGARVVSTYKGDGGTDHTIIELPDGRRYQFLHGLNA